MLLKLIDNGVKGRTCHDFSWVWRNRTSHKQVKIRINLRGEYFLFHISPSRVVLHQQLGYTVMMVVYLEQLSQSWLTDVKTYEDYFLFKQGETYCQVCSIEGLALTRC